MTASSVRQPAGLAGAVAAFDAAQKRRAFVLLDALAAPFALALAAALTGQGDALLGWPLAVAAAAGAAAGLAVRQRQRSFGRLDDDAVLRAAAIALGQTALWCAGLFMAGALTEVPRAGVVTFACLGFALSMAVHVASVAAVRVAGYKALVLAGPQARVPVLFVGAPEAMACGVEMLGQLPLHESLHAVGAVTLRPEPCPAVHGVPVLGHVAQGAAIRARLAAERFEVEKVVICAAPSTMTPAERAHIDALAAALDAETIDLIGPLERRMTASLAARATPVERTAQGLFPALHDRTYLAAKRALDLAVAAPAFLVALPVLAAVYAILRARLGAPVLFRQLRGGRGGRPFVLYKFRTMHFGHGADGRLLSDAEREDAVGRLFRRLRLDELPQLWNVVVGDLALVGPRPLVPADLADLPDGGRLRGLVRPGLTGWAQIHGGQSVSPEDKFVLDAWYLKNASLALDLRIMMKTPLALLSLESEHADAAAHAYADVRDVVAEWLPSLQSALLREQAVRLRAVQPERIAPAAAETPVRVRAG